jgi:ADP-heptose:LPS heptosyltransferase
VSVCPFPSESLDRLVEAVRPARTIGMGPPCTELVDYLADTHECDALFGVVRRVQPLARIEPFASPLPSSARSTETARRVRAALPTFGRLLVAHVDSIPEKSWPLASLDTALNQVLSAHDDMHAVVLNTRPGDLPAAVAGGRAVCLNGLSLDRAMSLVAACDLFVGVDSCMLHAADLCRRPGVGLFGSTQARRFGFRWSSRRVVRELQAGRTSDHDPLDVAAAIGSVLAARQRSAPGRHVTAG